MPTPQKAPSIVESPNPRRRVFVFIDGFNLYHRMLENKPDYKWLCLKTLCERHLFPKDNVESIKFFTAKVDPKTSGSYRQNRQLTYWRALRSTGIEVIEGAMEKRDRKCGVHKETPQICDKGASYGQYTEKMSDVNLALHIYRDYIKHTPDVLCVISADLDILPALRMVREEGKKVMIKVLLPTEDEGFRQSRVSAFNPPGVHTAIIGMLSGTFIKKSQFCRELTDINGDPIKCPDTWNPRHSPEQEATILK